MKKENKKLIDNWSFLHFLISFIIAYFLSIRIIMYILILIFEIIEKWGFESGNIPNVFKEIESDRNRIVDILVSIFGYEIGLMVW